MMVCSECDLRFCIGGPADMVKPQGHIREHALQEGHRVALRYRDLYAGYCFECENFLTICGEEDEEGRMVYCAADWHPSGFVIRGLPNHGNNSYLNALLQCLLVLGKLRARMFGLDAPLGLLGIILHDLFADTDSVINARGLRALLTYVRTFYSWIIGTSMQDSHKLLCCLRHRFNEEEKIMRPLNTRQSTPTVDSIFGGQLSVTMSCKCCSFKLVSHDVFYDLSVPLPPKGAPAKTIAPPPWIKRRVSQRKIRVELLPPIDKTNTEKFHTISEGGDSQIPASKFGDTVMFKTSDPLKVGKFLFSCA